MCKLGLGKGRDSRGHRVDVLPTPSLCPDKMFALHLVPHLTYSAGSAREGGSCQPGLSTLKPPSVQPLDSRERAQRLTPHVRCLTPDVEGGRAVCIERHNQIWFTWVLVSITYLTLTDLCAGYQEWKELAGEGEGVGRQTEL